MPCSRRLAKMTSEFFRAQLRAVGMELRQQPQIDALFHLCKNCPTKQYVGDEEKGQCMRCSCPLSNKRSRLNKLAVPTTSCPDGHYQEGP